MTNEEMLLTKILQTLEAIRSDINGMAKTRKAAAEQGVKESRRRSKLAGKMISEGLTGELVRKILNG